MKASLAIAALFRERIARGELRSGDPLPTEAELVEELGAAKSTVREALRILETEGLIEVKRGLGGGPRVRHPSIAEVARGVGVYLQIGDVLVTDVWESRDRIVGAAVERLAEQRAPEGVRELTAAVDALRALVGDFDAYYPQLLGIAETVVRAAGSETDYVLVVALRHVIASELEAATRAIVDVDEAVAAEDDFTRRWDEVTRHVRAGHARAAREAYDELADVLRTGLADLLGFAGRRVVDVVGEGASAWAAPALARQIALD